MTDSDLDALLAVQAGRYRAAGEGLRAIPGPRMTRSTGTASAR